MLPLNPYPGLMPFDIEHQRFFFGRDDQIREVVERLAANHFVAIIGGSGCGKSSLIRAGVLPELLAGGIGNAASNWASVVFRPEESPISNFAAEFRSLLQEEGAGVPDEAQIANTLRQRGGLSDLVRLFGSFGVVDSTANVPRDNINLLIVIDQFEEIFRPRNRGSDQVEALVNLLLDLAEHPHPRVFVILTMRSEDLHSCASFLGLPEALNRSSYLVPRLRDIQLKDVILKPAQRFAAVKRKPRPDFPDSVWTRIIESTLPLKDDPDHLPLLQHLLFQIWEEALALEKRDRGDVPTGISEAALNFAVGNPKESPHGEPTGNPPPLSSACLNNKAESIYLALDADQQLIAQTALTMMGTFDANGILKRNFASLTEIRAATGAAREHVAEVLDRFSAPHPYIRRGTDDYFDVAHEAFIRKWNTFLGWVTHDSERQHAFVEVFAAYESWRAACRNLNRNMFGALRALPTGADLNKWHARSVDRLSLSDFRRWASPLAIQRDELASAVAPNNADGGQQAREFSKIQSFLSLGKFKRNALNGAVFALVIVGAGVLYTLFIDRLERKLSDRQIMLPLIDKAIAESANPREDIDPLPVEHRVEHLRHLQESSYFAQAMWSEPSAWLSREKKDAFLVARSLSQKAAYENLFVALTGHIWITHGSAFADPEIPSTKCPSQKTSPSAELKLYTSTDDSRKLIIDSDNAVYGVYSANAGPCADARIYQQFPKSFVIRMDKGLHAMVVYVPGGDGAQASALPQSADRKSEWLVYLLDRPDQHTSGAPLIGLQNAPILEWTSNPELDPSTPFQVRYTLADNEETISISDGNKVRSFRRVVTTFNTVPTEQAVWETASPLNDASASYYNKDHNWKVFSRIQSDQPTCGLPLAQDGGPVQDAGEYCFKIERNPTLARNQMDPRGSPEYQLEFIVRGSEALPDTVRDVLIMPPMPFAAIPKMIAFDYRASSLGQFRALMADGTEYQGIWNTGPLEKLSRTFIGNSGQATCDEANEAGTPRDDLHVDPAFQLFSAIADSKFPGWRNAKSGLSERCDSVARLDAATLPPPAQR